MCAAAMVWAGVSRIVFAASEPDFSALLSVGPRFNLRCAEVVASSGEDVAIVGPALGSEALTPFRAPPPAQG
jgi:tRNA(Arg) A34 adenosine deaminase TadA